jgi:uncharacterized protein YkwD
LRPTRGSRLIALPAAVVLGLGLFAASLMSQPSVARAASGPLDAQASELVRLINGARAAEGRSSLSLDPFLASKARDGAIPCPDDATKTIAGRAQDFAAYGTMSHDLRLCDATSYTLSSTKFVTVLQTWAYPNVGEINLVNGGYGTGAFLYTYGAWQTWTYSTTGHAMMAWKTSTSHWNIIVGTYDRVGCGGWASGSAYYYECSFSAGGSSPNGLRSPPTKSPFSNPLPTSTPDPTGVSTPDPTFEFTPSPTACTTNGVPPGQGGGRSGGSGSRSASGTTPGSGPSAGSSSASSTPGADSTATSAAPSLGEAVAPATPGSAAAAAPESGSIAPSGGAFALPATIASVTALVGGSGAALLACCYTSLSLRRRRRRSRTVS